MRQQCKIFNCPSAEKLESSINIWLKEVDAAIFDKLQSVSATEKGHEFTVTIFYMENPCTTN